MNIKTYEDCQKAAREFQARYSTLMDVETMAETFGIETPRSRELKGMLEKAIEKRDLEELEHIEALSMAWSQIEILAQQAIEAIRTGLLETRLAQAIEEKDLEEIIEIIVETEAGSKTEEKAKEALGILETELLKQAIEKRDLARIALIGEQAMNPSTRRTAAEAIKAINTENDEKTIREAHAEKDAKTITNIYRRAEVGTETEKKAIKALVDLLDYQ